MVSFFKTVCNVYTIRIIYRIFYNYVAIVKIIKENHKNVLTKQKPMNIIKSSRES